MNSSDWEEYLGHELDLALHDIQLIRASALVELGDKQANQRARGVGIDLMPRCQDWPAEAVATIEMMHGFKSIPMDLAISGGLCIIVLSICWLDPKHPDMFGEQLQFLLPIFKAFEKKAPGVFAVMWDYISLPQKRVDGIDDRSEADKARFKRALGSINVWYAHQETYKLLVTRLPANMSQYSNPVPYSSRGWTSTERQLSTIVARGTLVLDLSNDFDTDGGLERIIKQCTAARRPPMRPDEFDDYLRDGVKSNKIKFTAMADLDVVCEQYKIGFLDKMKNTTSLSYCGVRWGDDEVGLLAKALEYAHQHGGIQNVYDFFLMGNRIGDEGASKLANIVNMGWMPNLQEVRLQNNRIGTSGQEALALACSPRSIKLAIGTQHASHQNHCCIVH